MQRAPAVRVNSGPAELRLVALATGTKSWISVRKVLALVIHTDRVKQGGKGLPMRRSPKDNELELCQVTLSCKEPYCIAPDHLRVGGMAISNEDAWRIARMLEETLELE